MNKCKSGKILDFKISMKPRQCFNKIESGKTAIEDIKKQLRFFDCNVKKHKKRSPYIWRTKRNNS